MTYEVTRNPQDYKNVVKFFEAFHMTTWQAFFQRVSIGEFPKDLAILKDNQKILPIQNKPLAITIGQPLASEYGRSYISRLSWQIVP